MKSVKLRKTKKLYYLTYIYFCTSTQSHFYDIFVYILKTFLVCFLLILLLFKCLFMLRMKIHSVFKYFFSVVR